MDITARKEHIYNVITDIVRGKQLANRLPDHALYIAEIWAQMPECSDAEMKRCINALCGECRLQYGQTLNDFWFKPKEKQQ
ncbi:MAG: hypothetical protein RSB23_05310 [Alistipes sp.]